MPQDKAFVDEIIGILAPLDVRARAMFGGYGMCCDEKFVAIIGDDRLFLKTSDADPDLFSELETALPYPGAKDHHVLTADAFGDGEWMRNAVQATADSLPVPNPKPKEAKG